jgi:hypothetical protein
MFDCRKRVTLLAWGMEAPRAAAAAPATPFAWSAMPSFSGACTLLQRYQSVHSNFDQRDSLKREKAYKREISVRPDSLHRQNVMAFSGIFLRGSLRRILSPPAYQSATVPVNCVRTAS